MIYVSEHSKVFPYRIGHQVNKCMDIDQWQKYDVPEVILNAVSAKFEQNDNFFI